MGKELNLVYDYETMGTDPSTCAACSLAMIKYDEKRFMEGDPYTFEELCDMALEVKFDVVDQVKNYGRIIEKVTLDWWRSLPQKVQDRAITPSDKDIKITELYQTFVDFIGYDKIKYTFTRGNNFDTVLTHHLFRVAHPDIPCTGPGNLHDQIHHFSSIRDIRTFISTMAYGEDLKTTFMPEYEGYFEAHNAVHDIAMDVLRMQHLVRTVYADDIIPF